MTPGARVAAAIEILDRVLGGEAAEKALTSWARASRFAGSKDRAAIRDHVFDALRRLRSAAAGGGCAPGQMTGRGVMIGLLREMQGDAAPLFSGEGHAPAPIGSEETARTPDPVEAMDLPDWLWPEFQRSLGEEAGEVAAALRERAPVFLRVNLLRATVEQAIAALDAEGIAARPHPLSPTALEVTERARRIALGAAYRDGLVELQDAASQAVVDTLPLSAGMRVLDYCAGGGGKALAIAARTGTQVDVHDADPRRMKDIPARATRAGADLRPVEAPRPGYDLVLCDAPCSGSGAWRRAPEGKWRLTPERLEELTRLQRHILAEAVPLVAPGGLLIYATCSLLEAENGDTVTAFTGAEPGWHLATERRFRPEDGGDGFYVAHLERDQ
ncbi:RsmB/NOP family class I SAM-dependent RNA methyltransferase [Aquicoccus sp. SCR17]|nr:RsmB/NOP family class I SAM-dependent RNA methyltransferase [Carideicomes alvinocaridis]